MLFSDVESSQGTIDWDASLWRIEAGAGYSVRRNVTLKGSYQYNRRDGGRETASSLAAAQVLLWF
jgi:opacity protein-like surface antigen